MERAELLSANGEIFTVQGKALNAVAAPDVKVLVVGNPANTNCLIAMNNAPDIPRERFTAMLRLDHNRAVAQLAAKLGVPVSRRLPDGRVGQSLPDDVPRPVPRQGRRPGGRGRGRRPGCGSKNEFLPERGQTRRRHHRGARRLLGGLRRPTPRSTTCTTGCAAPTDAWVSMGVPSDGSYGIPEGLICGFPCTCAGGQWSIVQGLDIDDFSRMRIDASVKELQEERQAVQELGLI